jgi:hypothetical protein
MQGTTEYEYGGSVYQIPQYDDGRYDCPLCSNRRTFDEIEHVGLHFAKGHDMHCKAETTCPTCGTQFTYESNDPRTYCSISCASQARYGETA